MNRLRVLEGRLSQAELHPRLQRLLLHWPGNYVSGW